MLTVEQAAAFFDMKPSSFLLHRRRNDLVSTRTKIIKEIKTHTFDDVTMFDRESVQQAKLMLVGVAHKVKRAVWTPQEIQILRSGWATKGLRIQKKLPTRTAPAIYEKVKALGLQLGSAHMKALTDISHELGVTPQAMKMRLLRVGKKPYLVGNRLFVYPSDYAHLKRIYANRQLHKHLDVEGLVTVEQMSKALGLSVRTVHCYLSNRNRPNSPLAVAILALKQWRIPGGSRGKIYFNPWHVEKLRKEMNAQGILPVKKCPR